MILVFSCIITVLLLILCFIAFVFHVLCLLAVYTIVSFSMFFFMCVCRVLIKITYLLT